MTRAGLAPESYIDCLSQENTITTVHSLLTDSDPPTALFAGNNLTMRWRLDSTRFRRVSVRRSGACCDRSALTSSYLPPFPTSSSPIQRIAPPAWCSISDCPAKAASISSAS